MTDLSIADVLDVEYPGAPEWSADGRFLAATLYRDDGNALVVADVAADEARRLSPGDGFVTGFAWGPDGRATDLLVATDAGETYDVDPSERTERLLARSPDGESDHEWSPDGGDVAFYRGGAVCVRDADSGAERVLDVPGHDTFLSSERMLAWDADGGRLAFAFTDRETRQIGVADPGSGELLWRTDGTASRANPAWLGDGRLVFERIADRRTVRSVVAADVRDGSRAELLRETDDRGVVSMGAPTVSPDGTRLALALSLDGWDHLYVVDAETGERTQLTSGEFEDKGLAGSTPEWVDDRTLLFASNRRDAGQRHLFAVDTETGSVTPVVESPGTNVHPKPSPDGETVAYVHADRQRSPELRAAALSDAGEDGDDESARLTRSAVEAWPVEPLEPSEVAFESADGTEIRGYLFDPRGTDAVADDAEGLPGVVWVHGGPMRQMRDGWHPSRAYGLAYAFHQYLAREGYVGLLVNYRGGIGYGRAFRQGLAGGYGRDEMDDVVAGAEYLRSLPYAGDRVGVWGLSYGGYATLQILGTHPDAFDVGINIAGLADLELYEDWAHETKFPAVESGQAQLLGGNRWDAGDEWDAANPRTRFDRYESPLYNFHGTGDAYVNFEQLDVVVDGMLEHGNEYEAEYYPDESHVFSKRATWERTFRKIEKAFAAHLRE